jgi:ssDNA-specific exonuclease RecJ
MGLVKAFLGHKMSDRAFSMLQIHPNCLHNMYLTGSPRREENSTPMYAETYKEHKYQVSGPYDKGWGRKKYFGTSVT